MRYVILVGLIVLSLQNVTAQTKYVHLLDLPKDTITRLPSIMVRQWSSNDLPFFCKIEHQIGKKTRTPIVFRLGSVEYVDYLEQKDPSTWLHRY